MRSVRQKTGVVGGGRDGRRVAKRRRRKDAGAERNRTSVGGVRVGGESDKMMRGGTYSACMKGVSDATWRKYHYDRQTAKRRRQTLKRSRPKMIGDGINMMSDGIIGAREPVNGANDMVNLQNDIVKCVRGNANDTVKSLIVQNPGITAVRMIEILNRSSSTVRRAIASLMKSGCIEHRGSDKTGGYYAIAESAPEQI